MFIKEKRNKSAFFRLVCCRKSTQSLHRKNNINLTEHTDDVHSAPGLLYVLLCKAKTTLQQLFYNLIIGINPNSFYFYSNGRTLSDSKSAFCNKGNNKSRSDCRHFDLLYIYLECQNLRYFCISLLIFNILIITDIRQNVKKTSSAFWEIAHYIYFYPYFCASYTVDSKVFNVSQQV